MKQILRSAWPYFAIAIVFVLMTSVNFTESISEEEQYEIDSLLNEVQQADTVDQTTQAQE